MLDQAARSRLLARYRFMFRASTVMLGAGVLLTALGVLAILFASTITVFGAGLLLAAVAGLNCYKIVTSTVRIIEIDAKDLGWGSVRS